MDYLPFSALRQTLGNEPPYCLNKVIPQCHDLSESSGKLGNLRQNSVDFRKFTIESMFSRFHDAEHGRA